MFGPILTLAFSGINNRIARKDEDCLLQDVQGSLSFLFEEYGGRVIPSDDVPFPPGFDYAFVTVSLGGFLLRFVRGRGELGVCLAPEFARSDWQELPIVLNVIMKKDGTQPGEIQDLWDVARELRPHMRDLIALFSPLQFTALKCKLEDEVYAPARTATEKMESRINRRLYGR